MGSEMCIRDRAEDAWNTCNPEQVSLAYTVDSYWRNRAEFIQGRTAIVEFLTRKWVKELDYRLIKELWAWEENGIAVRFAYEWHDDSNSWFRSYGNENWEFDQNGLMRRRLRLHQRPADSGIRPKVSLGSDRPEARGPSRPDRTWLVSAR